MLRLGRRGAYPRGVVWPAVVLLVAVGTGAAIAVAPDPRILAGALAALAFLGLAWIVPLGAPLTGVFLLGLPLFLVYTDFNPVTELTVAKDVVLGLAIVATAVDESAVRRLLRSWTWADTVLAGLLVLYCAYLPLAPSLTQGLFGFKVTFWYASVYFLVRAHAPYFAAVGRSTWLPLVVFGAFALWLTCAATIFFSALPSQSGTGRILWDGATRVRFSEGLQPVGIGLLFSVWLLLWRRGPAVRAVAAVTAIVDAGLLVFSDNRTAFVTVLAGLMVVVLLRIRDPRGRLLAAATGTLLLSIALIGAAQSGLLDPGAPLRLDTLGERLDTQLNVMLPTLAAAPMGTGAGDVAGTQATIAFKDLTSAGIDRSTFDSGYLTLALEVGVLPAAILAALLIGIVVMCVHAARDARSDLAVISAAAVLAFAISNVANPALYQFPFNAIAWFFAGLGVHAAGLPRDTTTAER